MAKKLCILHYNILEKYPPVMNFISDVLLQKSKYKISVFTSVNSSPYTNQNYNNVTIWRFGSVSQNSILRYFAYIFYNLLSTLIILQKRPDVLLVYETLSIFPAFVYSLVSKKKIIHIHYHEYISLLEKNNASKYMKFLFWCEGKLLNKITCSLTNEDRKAMFLEDNPNLSPLNVEVYPNLPPETWWRDYGMNKKSWQGGKIKLVYVGVLDAETMFLEEVLKWVNENSEELELTIFSQSVSDRANQLLQKFESNSIILKQALNYYKLPSELVNYDIGLVLYKGHTPNYVYNVPNKIFEYLYCGLKVIGDKCLKSTAKLDCSEIFLTDLNTGLSINSALNLIGIPSQNTNFNFHKMNQKFE